jgi:hypothetical protein
MEIRKADSKGRVTVGANGEAYYVRRYSTGAILLEPVASEMVLRFPVPDRALDYMREHGIEPNTVSSESVDRYGYFRARSSDKSRQDWPEGFDWDDFKALVG